MKTKHTKLQMRSVERGIYNERTVPIIKAGCIAHVRNGRISTSVKNLTSPSCSATLIS